MLKILNLKTNGHTEFIDITHLINQTILESEVDSGICTVYVPHTTAGVFINENADPDVIYDVKTHLEKLIPWVNDYRHIEGNSAAHIKSILTGNSINLLIENKKLLLGTWQGIFFAEFDGPRSRKIFVKIIKG